MVKSQQCVMSVFELRSVMEKVSLYPLESNIPALGAAIVFIWTSLPGSKWSQSSLNTTEEAA